MELMRFYLHLSQNTWHMVVSYGLSPPREAHLASLLSFHYEPLVLHLNTKFPIAGLCAGFNCLHFFSCYVLCWFKLKSFSELFLLWWFILFWFLYFLFVNCILFMLIALITMVGSVTCKCNKQTNLCRLDFLSSNSYFDSWNLASAFFSLHWNCFH